MSEASSRQRRIWEICALRNPNEKISVFRPGHTSSCSTFRSFASFTRLYNVESMFSCACCIFML